MEGDRIVTIKTNDDSLLAHLAWMLSSRHEDVAVEALGYILKSATARKVLEYLVKSGGTNTGEISSVRTQVGGEDGTRPDLVGFDENSNECLIIEAKFWAGLTGNQPTADLKRLPSEKALLFVVPVSRIETLWAELRHLAGIYGSISIFMSSTEFKSATVSRADFGTKYLMLISWQDLLNHLENADDLDMIDEIRQLQGFVNRIDESGFPPLRIEELGPEFPRRLRGLRQLVNDATNRSVERQYADIAGLRITPRYRGYGRYLRIAGAGVWFGVDSVRWAKGSYPDTPIWLIFEQWKADSSIRLDQTRKALESLEHSDPKECYGEVVEVVVPIPLPVGIDYESVLESVVGRIKRIAELITAHTQNYEE